MRVDTYGFWQQFLNAHRAQPELMITLSLSPSPPLGEFLGELDPKLPLDWSDQDYQGLPRLREKVLERYGYAPVCSPADVMITAGAQEANYLAISQLLQAGDEMVIDAPGWQQPLVMARGIGVITKKARRIEAKGWALDVDHLASLVTPKTKLVFLCNPNNPTGRVEDEATVRRICAIADKVGAYVLQDEVYRGLEWTDHETPRVATFYDRGISTGSVSKMLGLQGLRTGWMICRDRSLIAEAMVLRENTSEIMNVMGEMIADVALRPDRFEAGVKRSRASGAARVDVLDRFVDAQPALTWHRPQGALLGLARVDLPLTADDISAKLMAAPYRTFVMSGSAYDCPKHVRLGAGGMPSSGLEEGLARFGALLESLRSGTSAAG